MRKRGEMCAPAAAVRILSLLQALACTHTPRDTTAKSACDGALADADAL